MPKEYATADTFRRVTVDQLRSILDVFALVVWPEVPHVKLPAKSGPFLS